MKQLVIGTCKALGWACSHYNLIGMWCLYALAFVFDKLMWLSKPRIRKETETFNSSRIYDKQFGVGVHG